MVADGTLLPRDGPAIVVEGAEVTVDYPLDGWTLEARAEVPGGATTRLTVEQLSPTSFRLVPPTAGTYDVWLTMLYGLSDNNYEASAGYVFRWTVPSTSETALDVIVKRDDHGELPPDTLVTCGRAPFPLSALHSLEPLPTTDPPGFQQAFDDVLAGPAGGAWSPDGWAILTKSDTDVQLLHIGAHFVESMTFHRIDDEWRMTDGTSGATCTLRTVLPDGLNVVEWTVDPSRAADPDRSEIHVLVTESACANGRPPGARLLGPQVIETAERVLIAFAAIAQEDDQDCPSNPPSPVTVTLSQPLGQREALDGLVITTDLAAYLGIHPQADPPWFDDGVTPTTN